MEKLNLDLPAMYGDHHVLEVRRILFEIPGVDSVYASSSFHVAEVIYDPAQVSAEIIMVRLEEIGYLEPLDIPLESGKAAYQGDPAVHFRHSIAYTQTGRVQGFAQNVAYWGRPLWPCPGMGSLRLPQEGE